MKRLLAALFFLVLIVLVWFFWQEGNVLKDKNSITQSEENKQVDSSIDENQAKKKIRFRPERREVKVPLDNGNLEIEVVSDENGVIITKIGDKKVNKRVSSKPVQRLSIRDGIMSFWEVDEEAEKIKYRSINLGAFVDQLK